MTIARRSICRRAGLLILGLALAGFGGELAIPDEMPKAYRSVRCPEAPRGEAAGDDESRSVPFSPDRIAVLGAAQGNGPRPARARPARPEPADGVGHPLRPADYRDFAMRHEGDRGRGEALFNDAKRITCLQCHTADGKGGKAGPDLLGIGDKYPRRELVGALLEPSAAILPGYSTTIVATKSGEIYQGVLKPLSETEVELRNAEGGPVRIATGDI